MKSVAGNLKFGVSSLAVVASVVCATSAVAQSTEPAPQVTTPQGLSNQTEEGGPDIVVTGTSIRGVAPVGSNLIAVGQEQIDKVSAPTITQLLQTVPALSNMGQSGRGGNGNGGVGGSVYIHQIGASAQNSTLVLVDGHRLPPSGVTSSVVDPNNIPAIMLERVEVLAEGASSIYGSDAVAGVVNFITRKSFDGVEFRAQITHTNDIKPGFTGGILAGQSWDTGNALVAYQYTFEDELRNTDRPKTNPLLQGARAAAAGLSGPGNTNFGNFNCNPAAIRPGAAGSQIYPSPTSTSPVSTAAANSTCSQWEYGTLLPQEKRHNAMIRVTQELNDKLTLSADFTYNKRNSVSPISRGTLTANAFAGGAVGAPISSSNPTLIQAGQVNPFYTNVTGRDDPRQEIRYDFNQLFGTGAITRSGDETLYGSLSLNYKVGGDWEIDAIGVAGRAASFFGENEGAVNTQLATLYLNGTTQTNGDYTQPSLPGGGDTIRLNLPLTPDNALDVWNPAGSNRTAQAVRDAILDSRNMNRQTNTLEQARLTASGTVFDLPAGPLKVAIGGEYVQMGITQLRTNPLAIGGTSIASQFFRYKFGRSVVSGFVEANVPVISEEMGIPLINKLDLSLALRHDHYSDFGDTTNPKFSINWDPFPGLRLRGNYSTSFVAPGLNINGRPYGNANFAGVTTVSNNFNIPLANYPTLREGIANGQFQGLLNNCSAGAATCNIGALQGIQGNVGDPENGPQEGKGWSVGADFEPEFIPGLRVSATLWDVEFLGGITNPSFSITVQTQSIADRIIFYPNCATPADVAATVGTQPVLSNFPACISYIGIGNNGNYLNFFTRGLDLSASYTRDTDIGTFTIGGDLTQLLKFDQGFAGRGQKPTPEQTFSVKNTVGLNTTFPNVGTQLTGHLGWADEGLSADIYANYTGSYKNVSASAVNPIELTEYGVYSGRGGDKVKANTTFDLTLGYTFQPTFFEEAQVQLRVRNVFDKYPPYFNSSTGYDPYVGNILGRTIALSLRAKIK